MRYAERMYYQLKVTLKDVRPPVWRRVIVPTALTLLELHHVIQIVMCWEDCHLHDFTIERRRYALPNVEDFDEPADESKTALGRVVAPRDTFVYQYDFGDGWEHAVLVEKVVESGGTALPICLAGERACPPEDSGGPFGYEEKLRAFTQPSRSNKELRDWLGSDFDPAAFDVNAINEELRQFFQPRRKPKRNTDH